ncbi:MAG: methyltransferase domain-containing protein [Candidatus Eiseniibacteriota bacterium]|nr:MAG: methyltransferase domain-containing protein [Candidatus Eisenbacteria bacterium]
MSENRIPRADYSSIGEYYDKVRPVPAEAWISRIISVGGIAPGCDVLDIGCGTGRFTLRVARASGARVCGIDSSAVMLQNALKSDTQRTVRWALGDAHSLPFKPESFDCVYMTMVLHHIQQRDAALADAYRVLRPGGRCLVATSSHSSIRTHVLRHFPGVAAIDLRRFPSIPLVKSTLRGLGFENVRSTLVKHDEGEIPVDTYLRLVRNKYISTLSLLSESEFQAGLSVFERRVRELYGDRMRRVLRFTFVTGEKAGLPGTICGRIEVC